MSIATSTHLVSRTPKLDLSGCVFYAPLWRPDMGGDTSFVSAGEQGVTRYTCTVTGATYGSQGRSFDGNDIISLPSGATWNFAADFTIIVQFRLNQLNRMLVKSVSNQDWNVASANDWLVDVGADQKARLYIKSDATSANSTNINTNNWYRLAITRISNTIKLYINGVNDTAGSPSSSASLGNTQVLEMGRIQTNLDASLDGIEGEVLIYGSRGLSTVEIQRDYSLSNRWM